MVASRAAGRRARTRAALSRGRKRRRSRRARRRSGRGAPAGEAGAWRPRTDERAVPRRSRHAVGRGSPAGRAVRRSRTLRRMPGFAAVAVLMLAVGIGATSVMFTVVNSVLLKPLSYPEPERLLTVHGATATLGEFWGFSNPDFNDLSARDPLACGRCVDLWRGHCQRSRRPRVQSTAARSRPTSFRCSA